MTKPMNRFPKRKFRKERKEKLIDDRNIVLIICEGKTEEKHFKELRGKLRDSRLNIISIDAKGTAPATLFKEAKKYMKEKHINITTGDKVWILFDKDNNTQHDINMIVERSRSKSFDIGFSNPSFEIWYLFHFDRIRHRIDNDELLERLERFIPDYKKGCGYIEMLFPNQTVAIENANNLITYHQDDQKNLYHDESNPITHVGRLVQFILEF